MPPTTSTARTNQIHRPVLEVEAAAGDDAGAEVAGDGEGLITMIFVGEGAGDVAGGAGDSVATGFVGTDVGDGLFSGRSVGEAASVGGACVLVGRGRSVGDLDGTVMLLDGFTLGPFPEQADARRPRALARSTTPSAVLPPALGRAREGAFMSIPGLRMNGVTLAS